MSATGGDEDVPPLEDMSHAFKSPPPPPSQQQQQPPQAEKSVPQQSASHAAAASTASSSSSAAQKSDTAAPAKSKQSAPGFAGMKRGFLTSPKSTASTSSSTSCTKQPQPQHQPDLPYIRSDPAAAQSSLQLDEVQLSLRQQSAEGLLGGGGGGDKSWLTEDLLAKVESDPFLTGCLANPRMSAALAKFQADPKRAIAEYQNDEEVQRFLKAFSGILGDHFATIADKQPPPQQQAAAAPAAVDPEVAEVLARPGVREALTSADVQRWMELMRADPAAAQAQLRTSRDVDFQRRVRLLFENGLLGFAK